MNGSGRIPRARQVADQRVGRQRKLRGAGVRLDGAQLIAKRNVRTPVDFSLAKSCWSSGWPLLMPKNSARGRRQRAQRRRRGRARSPARPLRLPGASEAVGPGIRRRPKNRFQAPARAIPARAPIRARLAPVAGGVGHHGHDAAACPHGLLEPPFGFDVGALSAGAPRPWAVAIWARSCPSGPDRAARVLRGAAPAGRPEASRRRAAGTAAGRRKVLGILIDRRRTGHRGGRWRREDSHNDRHPTQVKPGMPRSSPLLLRAKNSNPWPRERRVGHGTERAGQARTRRSSSRSPSSTWRSRWPTAATRASSPPAPRWGSGGRW